MGSARIIIVCGATASGKSARALELAAEHNGVIVNADSQQMYREFRILTARPSDEDISHIPHKLYGVLSAQDSCSAAIWLRYAKMEIDWTLQQGIMPIIVGGTGLYLKSLMSGIAEIPDVPITIRSQAQADLEVMGGIAFHQRLSEVDAVSAAKLRPADSQRLVRAYSVWLASGKPLSWWQDKGNKRPYDNMLFDVVHVQLPREELYARINKRVETMIQEGAVEEVQEWLLTVKHLTTEQKELLPAYKIIGVREIENYLNDWIGLEEAIKQIQQHTRNYAKRQLTWFRNQL